MRDSTSRYLRALFPISGWLPRYRWSWLGADLIAGATVAAVAIPQALAYARLAGLPLQFGLYTSFVGTIVYCLFATSKDATIGPTAVLSQLTAQIAATFNPDGAIDPVVFSVAVALVAGIIETAIGLLRLGIVVDFIPVPVIIGFTTGAGVSIIIGQIAGLIGITGIDTNAPAYLVLYSTVSNIAKTRFDAVFGLVALIVLLASRYGLRELARRGHTWAIWTGYASNVVVIILATIVSFIYNILLPTPGIRIVGFVPRGLNYIRVPSIPDVPKIFSASITIVIVGILEHIAVTKSFGRINGYSPDANQEIIALGVNNIIASFFGAFPSTGSFSRSAIKSRSGVKSPLAGVYTGILVLISIYFLTPLFYYIPNAVLSAIIINAITDLITRPAVLVQLYNIDILDLVSTIIAFIFTIFFSIEIGIYASVGFSTIVLLVRVARPRYHVLIRHRDGTWVPQDDVCTDNSDNDDDGSRGEPVSQHHAHVGSPPPGIFVFRIEEALSYPNSNYLSEKIRSWVMQNAAYGGATIPVSERLWSYNMEEMATNALKHANTSSIDTIAVTSNGDAVYETTSSLISRLPPLRAIVFDLSAVNGIDATGMQALVDIKRDLDRFANHPIPFYFAHVQSKLTRVLTYFYELVPAENQMVAPVSIVTREYPSNTDVVDVDTSTAAMASSSSSSPLLMTSSVSSTLSPELVATTPPSSTDAHVTNLQSDVISATTIVVSVEPSHEVEEVADVDDKATLRRQSTRLFHSVDQAVDAAMRDLAANGVVFSVS